ncbi:Z1 domain-containing protein [Dyadobacter chenhuakuii]|uniref:Z1 domain-containing protein n=1 Tax=Dyadobacter chenhuakuii TaxID=2909339 RepID=A0A9X1QGZ4_9BACT|nr:Z1 domain-containing protein [Dyadobacter chenhuakuii]MCF2501361.1 Z1 domain-containing protein [Dyadobacter chenhuakuii]
MTNSECIEFIKSFIKQKAIESGRVNELFFDKTKLELISVKDIFPGLSSFDETTFSHLYDVSVKEYQSVFPIEIDPSISLVKKGFVTWLTEKRKEELATDYIDRYLRFLSLKKGRSERVVNELASSSEKILSKLGDPKSNTPFYTKGLVVGSVQSGKTGNFNAVINRSIDAGYSLIVILSGIMEDLRSQTQLRISEEVIGEGTDISKGNIGDIGVAQIRKFGERGDQSVAQVFSITSYKSDFKRTVKDIDFSLNKKNILVCKKNTGVLKNLLIWLSDSLNEREKHDIPLLIVDDEADNASLNNLGKKGAEYASAINGQIRALLEMFTKKSYLGYTATPFANVLQDRHKASDTKLAIAYKVNGVSTRRDFDMVPTIFPENFIELLNPPSNYIGAKQIFETVLDESVKIPMVEVVRDTNFSFPSRVPKEDGTERAASRNDSYPESLPSSLEEATHCFLLGIALRLSRTADMADSGLLNPHHTMLVHISRFIPWQNKTKVLIEELVKKLEEDINNDLPNNRRRIYGTLEKSWNKYFAAIVHNIRTYLPEGYSDEFLVPKKFEDIKSYLIEAAKGIEVKAINSETGDKLQYIKDSSGNGKKYIAVGGNRLSRGFTLEGLTINYFIRNTNYSDTLLQMGRWFGYRPGYLDCCKVFTTPDAVQKFDSTTRAIEELEAEFGKMNRDHLTPTEFVLRVRKHPGTLKITRPAILKDTKVVNWSYQDQLVQTTRFKINDAKRLDKSWEDFKDFIISRDPSLTEDQNFIRVDLDVDQVIEFLRLPNTFEDFEMQSIIRFIELCAAKGKLKKWTVAIKVKGRGESLKKSDTGFPADIDMSQRSGPGKVKKETEYSSYLKGLFLTDGIFSSSGKSANIVAAGSDFNILLSKEQIKKAEAKFRAETKEKFKEKNSDKDPDKVTVPERVYREEMSDETALIVVYLIDLKSVFLQSEPEPDVDFGKMITDYGINTAVPLIGYAIGFPKISPDPGGEYVHGDYEMDEEGSDEWDESLESTDE